MPWLEVQRIYREMQARIEFAQQKLNERNPQTLGERRRIEEKDAELDRQWAEAQRVVYPTDADGDSLLMPCRYQHYCGNSLLIYEDQD